MPYSRLDPMAVDLPVADVFDDLVAAISRGSLVVTAAPGAGKSTLIPFAVDTALARANAKHRVVVVLEPRRLAARATAGRLAELIGEPIGRHIGLTIRGDRSVGSECRIEVMTEAVLTRRIQLDPELPGVGAIVFDEFHERNLHSDLGLAMALEARETLRPDLKLVVMSATIDAAPIRDLLGDGEAIDVPGRVFPVTTEHRARPRASNWASAVADAASDAAGRTSGDVLIFAPGKREIDDVLRHLANRGLRDTAFGLHGGSAQDLQKSVLASSPRQRIIVATAVAETSVTIPGVESVVDGGLSRRARFDPATGLGRLETGHVTRFSADQRRGRAGRTKPGLCIRLWSIEDDLLLTAALPPEIIDGDPLPVAMELLRWGDPDGLELRLLDRPARHRLAAARKTLEWLGLVESGGLTARGRAASKLPAHPRTSALLLTALTLGRIDEALLIAAILDSDRHPTSDDLLAEVDRQQSDHTGARSVERLRRSLKSVNRKTLPPAPAAALPEGTAALMASAWPDRIALARPERDGQFLLASGREVSLARSSRLVGATALVVADSTVDGDSGRIRLAIPLERSLIGEVAKHWISEEDSVEWDDRSDTLTAERQRRLGAIVLHRSPVIDPPIDDVQRALREGIRRIGLSVITWNENDLETRRRLDWLHQEAPNDWPDVSDTALLNSIDTWLDLSRVTTPKQLRRIHPGQGLRSLLDWRQRAAFDEMAPITMPVVGGRSRAVRYDTGRPVWSVRIQDLFGTDRHPTVGPNQTPITIELLSPANRPAQTTTDLPGFWRGSYAAVRSDLRGRYPKHSWPENPAEPPEPG